MDEGLNPLVSASVLTICNLHSGPHDYLFQRTHRTRPSREEILIAKPWLSEGRLATNPIKQAPGA